MIIYNGYWNMCSRLTIEGKQGKIIIDGSDGGGGIISAIVENNPDNFTSKATVQIPRAYKIFRDKKILDYIDAGDRVQLELGYNNHLHTEFEGYINKIGSDIPIELELDGKFYPYRQNTFRKVYTNAALKQVLNDLFPGLNVNCPEMNLGRFQIDNASAYDVLVKLNGAPYRLFFDIDNKTNTLKASLLDLAAPGDVVNAYYLCDKILENGGRILKGNVKKHDLKYNRKEDLKIQFEVKGILPNGKKISVVVGDQGAGAAKRSLNMGVATSEADLRAAALRELERVKYDGFTGSLTGFGIPVVNAGTPIRLTDFEFPEHDGIYFAQAVKVSYSISGFERQLTLKYKL